MIAVNVAGLLHEVPGATRELRLRDHYTTLGPDLELAGPIEGLLRLQRTNRGVLARGSVTAPLRRTCARCLEPYVEDVVVTIDEEFLPSLDPQSGQPVEIDDADQTLRIDDHHEIDFGPVLHDELSLTEPMHPLCRPDCPGLCPVCGAPLADALHLHEADEPDPRLAPLARLLDRHDN
jgi:uncharacterized protein